ncbi:MAG TPA: lysylphosphatidylglycerol synthase transmembrane domain-containing protein [Candidatus Omnitrophota bacterium]|nr:lysylphosphatidylglycerol synthase transmembrane domain-containing protein [Candidatus Omnitrophota bacterium]
MIFSSLLTIFIFIFLFWHIDSSAVFRTIKNCDRFLIIQALFLSLWSNIFVNALRCREILSAFDVSLSLFETILLKGGGSLFKTFLPARSGEFVMTAVYLKNIKNFPCQYSFLIIIFEYFLNFTALAFLSLTGILFSSIHISPGAILSYPAGYVLSFQRDILKKWTQEIKMASPVFQALSLRGSIILYTFLYMGVELVTFHLIARSLNMAIPFKTILLLIPAAFLLSSLPLTLGGLGQRECAIVFLFSPYAPAEQLLSAGILYSFIENLCPLLINAFLTGLSINKLWKGGG